MDPRPEGLSRPSGRLLSSSCFTSFAPTPEKRLPPAADRRRGRGPLPRDRLDWANTTGSARRWWEAFKKENAGRPGLVLRLAEELANRKATLTEFFLACVYSNTDNIQANLLYLDYTRLKTGDSAGSFGFLPLPPCDLSRRREGRGPGGGGGAPSAG
jgi:hypothetical protein